MLHFDGMCTETEWVLLQAVTHHFGHSFFKCTVQLFEVAQK